MTKKQAVKRNSDSDTVPSLVELLRENDLTNAVREVMRRAPRAPSRATQLTSESVPELPPEDAKRLKHPQGTVPALANSLMIISFLNSRAPEPQTLATIASNLRITKSHCHAILRTLVYFEWVGRNDRDKTYRLLPSALADISSLFSSQDLEFIRECLSDLVAKSGLPCILAEPLEDGTFVVIESFRSRHLMQLYFPVGYRLPRFASAVTKSLLAWADSDAVDAFLQRWQPPAYTHHSVRTADELVQELENTRNRGYSTSIDEFSDNMSAVAMPIFDQQGNVRYLASCSYLSNAVELDPIEIASHMREAIDRIHRLTRAQPPASFSDA